MVILADPAGANGINVCRLYSPEINTKEKLRQVLARALEDDANIDGELSHSTMQRIIDNYVQSRRCAIEFNQSDHNACPNCKTLNYAVLQFHYEFKQLGNLTTRSSPFPGDLSIWMYIPSQRRVCARSRKRSIRKRRL